MRYVCWHDDTFISFDCFDYTTYGKFYFAIQNVDHGIEGRGMLRNRLFSIKGKKSQYRMLVFVYYFADYCSGRVSNRLVWVDYFIQIIISHTVSIPLLKFTNNIYCIKPQDDYEICIIFE